MTPPTYPYCEGCQQPTPPPFTPPILLFQIHGLFVVHLLLKSLKKTIFKLCVLCVCQQAYLCSMAAPCLTIAQGPEAYGVDAH